MGYAADVTKDVITYRLQKAGFGDGSRIALSEEYQLKPSDDSSHGRISKLLQCRPPSRILDLGCSSGLLSERLRRMGHQVVGVDVNELDGREGAHQIHSSRLDLNEGIPSEVGSGFDIVLAADVLEHVVNPGALDDPDPETSSTLTGPLSSAFPTSPTGIRGSARRSGCSTTTSEASWMRRI